MPHAKRNGGLATCTAPAVRADARGCARAVGRVADVADVAHRVLTHKDARANLGPLGVQRDGDWAAIERGNFL